MGLTPREMLDRYGPTLAVIAALIVLVAVFPAAKTRQATEELTSGQGTLAGGAVPTGEPGSAGVAAGGAGSSGAVPGAGGSTVGTGATASTGGSTAAAKKVCRADGRQRGISRIMPTCLALFQGINGGATARGVTKDSFTIVRYMARVNPATEAALQAAGATDSEADSRQMDAALVDYFKMHYETYGRAPKIIEMPATGASDDDSAMRADAKTIADKHKAFVMWFGSGSSDTLAEEVADRGVICICTTSLSERFYHAHRGRIFSSLPSQEEYMAASAEYIGKRLANRPAKWAGAGSQGLPRKIGLVFQEASSNGPKRFAKEGRDFFKAELKKYGVTLAHAVGYNSNPTQWGQQSTNVISQLKDAGVTTVAFHGDPLFPIAFTKEATRQTYFPEWHIQGTQLVDTTFFGRNYDRAQWSHAFGISPLWVFHVDVATSSGYREYHHMRPGANRGDEGVAINTRRAPIQWIFQGVHMAGPRLTPQTFAQGMWNFPRSGGTPDAPLVFFTPEHSMAIKDFTEVWWNPEGSGRDETGKDGPGTLMKVNGGKRWLTGTWPRTEPKVFTMAGAVFTRDSPNAPKHEQDGHRHDLKKGCMSC